MNGTCKLICAAILSHLLSLSAHAQPTELSTGFTYQGELKQNGSPATGLFDLQLSLWNTEAGGIQRGAIVLLTDVNVVDGLFTVCPNFGVAVFDGSPHFLQIEVRPAGGGGSFTALNPRQEIKAAPYALQTRGIFVNQSKDVGIGTTSPQYKLHVHNTESHAIVGEAHSTTAQHFGV